MMGGFNLATKKFLQQVEHGEALLLYTLMAGRFAPVYCHHLRKQVLILARLHMHHSGDRARWWTGADFSTYSLPHLMPMAVGEPALLSELEAVIESPNAIDADHMSHEGIENRPCRSLVIVRPLCRVTLALLDLLLHRC